jgi:sulfate-transporting ATPase
MGEPVKFLILGLGLGAMYALAAQGLVLIHRGSGVLNFAQGAMAMIGALVYASAREGGWAPALALVAGVAAAAACGALTYLLVMHPLRRAAPLTRLVATLGVMTVLQAAATLHVGAEQRFVASLLPTQSLTLFSDVTISAERIWLVGICIVLTAVLWIVYRQTRFGLQTTAVAENPRASAALGHSPEAVALANWTLGAALAGVAGCLLVPITGLSVNQLTLLVLPALAAALVGGFTSFPLTLLGGLSIGVAESELTRYVTAPGWAKSVPLVVIVVILIARGTSLPARSQAADRLPRLGRGRVRKAPLAAATVAGLLALALIGGGWTDAFTTTLITALVCLSLVVVTGYAGQLSLVQFTLAGAGAFVAAHVSSALGWPFPVVAAAGALAAIPVGLLVALPALRTRGPNLAIATLGLALVIGEVVFSNPSYTGGFQGVSVQAPSIAGIDLDPIAHPARYASLCLLILVAVSLMVVNLRQGRAGRRLIAVRENERAAATLGISVFGAKLYAFGLAAAIAGLAGALMAFRTSNVLFSGFDVFASINVVLLAVIGGVGAALGAALGGLLAVGGLAAYAAQELLGWEQRYLTLVSGILLLVTLLSAPDGVARQLAAQTAWVRAAAGRLVGRTGRVAAVEAAARADVPRSAHRVPEATLSVEGARVRFGGVTALDGVSLTVTPGEVVGLIGPNGAGKTTLIDAVSGLTPLADGTIALSGRRIDGWSPRQRAQAGIGRSFQSLELFEEMTVRDNLRAACDPRDSRAYLVDLVHPRDPDLPPAALAAIDVFELADDLDRFPGELSYGARRMVGIARAVAGEPSVLLLDEPAAGLNERETRELGELVQRLAREWGLGILLVEHDVGLVMSICDRVVALDLGTLLATGAPDAVRRHPAVVASYLGDETTTGTVAEAGHR